MLAVSALLVAWPWAAKCVALSVGALHAVVRRPRYAPPFVLGADGSCIVPGWGLECPRLGSRTVVGPWHVHLDLGAAAPRRDILLVVDQLTPDEWRRLRALLRRLHRD